MTRYRVSPTSLNAAIRRLRELHMTAIRPLREMGIRIGTLDGKSLLLTLSAVKDAATLAQTVRYEAVKEVS